MKTQTLKQFELERLIKDGTDIPASKLAETNTHELLRASDFEDAQVDEERYRKSSANAPDDKLKNQPLARWRLEE